jgi:hypothetical protein
LKLKANATLGIVSREALKAVWSEIPGSLWESFNRNMSAKIGKWFKHASAVSKTAFREIMAILADANAK